MLLWLIAAGGALVAVMALMSARRLRRRLEQLTQAYWELRYEHTTLRAQVARLDPESAPPPEPPAAPETSFVPLSSLKK
jgi:hypothetical protein